METSPLSSLSYHADCPFQVAELFCVATGKGAAPWTVGAFMQEIGWRHDKNQCVCQSNVLIPRDVYLEEWEMLGLISPEQKEQTDNLQRVVRIRTPFRTERR